MATAADGRIDPATMAELRGALRARRDELWHEHGIDEEWLTEIGATRESELEEQAQGTRDARILDRLDERARREADAVEAALRRIADGTYGACLECGEPIPVARLRALPEAALCVSCAEAAERHARARGEEQTRPEAPPAPPSPGAERLSDEECETMIRERVRDDGRIDAQELEVACHDGVVHLAGALPSEGEHQMLLKVVTDVLGFREVEDRLSITRAPWERRERAPRPTAPPLPADAETEGVERTRTENVEETQEDGMDYEPPTSPPGEEER